MHTLLIRLYDEEENLMSLLKVMFTLFSEIAFATRVIGDSKQKPGGSSVTTPGLRWVWLCTRQRKARLLS